MAAIAVIGNGTFALAQSPVRNRPTTTRPAARTISAPVASITASPTPAAFIDYNPYQSQVSLRINSPGINNGNFLVIPAGTVGKYIYHTPGIQADQFALNTALMYDKRNPLPKVAVSGANYTFYDGGYLTTLSGNGSFNYKGKTTFKPAIIGGVWFTEQDTNNLTVVNSLGNFLSTFKPAPAIKVAGGNYFIDQVGALTTMRSMGNDLYDIITMVTRWDGTSYNNTRGTGGNFFVSADGMIVTVSSITGFTKSFKPTSLPKLIGGNYYIGMDDHLYTVSADGNLTMTDDFTLSAVPNLMGYSFMKFPNGRILMVDSNGLPHDSLLHISSTGTNVEVVKTISSNLDPKSIYLPKSSK